MKAELLAEAVRRIQLLIKWGGSIGNRQKAKAEGWWGREEGPDRDWLLLVNWKGSR